MGRRRRVAVAIDIGTALRHHIAIDGDSLYLMQTFAGAVLTGLGGMNAAQGMPVVGRGHDHRVDVLVPRCP